MNPAVFLDRDDTLIRARGLPAPPHPAKPGDLTDPALVELLPGAAEACARLAAAGFVLVVVSNQGVVARAAIPTARVEAVHDRIRELLRTPLVFYYCPFHPDAPPGRFAREHNWRKPAPGMLLAAMRELRLDPARSWLVGDSPRDTHAGLAAGLDPRRCLQLNPELPDLPHAADLILNHADR